MKRTVPVWLAVICLLLIVVCGGGGGGGNGENVDVVGSWKLFLSGGWYNADITFSSQDADGNVDGVVTSAVMPILSFYSVPDAVVRGDEFWTELEYSDPSPATFVIIISATMKPGSNDIMMGTWKMGLISDITAHEVSGVAVLYKQ